MKRFAALLLFCLLLVQSCASYKDISVTSFRLVSLAPRGLSAMDALVDVGVHNPAMGFELSDVSGEVKIDGTTYIVLNADRLVVDRKSDKIYSLPVRASLPQGITLFHLFGKFSVVGPDRMSVDVAAKIAMRGGAGKTIRIKDIPVESLLNGK